MAETWRLIGDEPLPGGWNMAADFAILRAAEEDAAPPTLRFYGWSRSTLSIGFRQDARRDLDMSRIRQSGVSVVRRPTGGRAILHHDEVTYAVILPVSSSFYGPLRSVYSAVSAALREALESLGTPLDPAAGRRGGFRNPCCFASRTPYEISSRGRKVVGSAQRRLKRAALQHGSIVLSQDAERLVSLLKWDGMDDRERTLAALGGINDNGAGVSVDAIRRAVTSAFERMYGIEFGEGGLTDSEKKLAENTIEDFTVEGV
ncbi:MAG: lipoate--protein ligase family protein [Candidatus Nitrospinota bacterium M3_3B_026]